MSATIIPLRRSRPDAWTQEDIAELARWNNATSDAPYYLMDGPIDDTDVRCWLVSLEDGAQYASFAATGHGAWGPPGREVFSVTPENGEWLVNQCWTVSEGPRFPTLRGALESIVATLA